jgi:hypothetical protein
MSLKRRIRGTIRSRNQSFGSFAAGCAALFTALALLASSAVASTQILDYEVDHPWLGKIGTYVNQIVRDGTATTVTSTLRVDARILGIEVHREYADRVELWQNGRIISFNGVTTVNGKPFPVQGKARGNAFVVTSPEGSKIAPADVYPNNPWSCAFTRGNSIFAVNTGTVEPGQVTGGESVEVDIDGKRLLTRHYRVESTHTHANVWLDPRCVPIKEDVMMSGTDITLILKKESDTP